MQPAPNVMPDCAENDRASRAVNVVVGGGVTGAAAAGATVIESKFATYPSAPAVSALIRSTCVPAESVTPLFPTVAQLCQSLVSGTLSVPVLSTPSTSTWNLPPLRSDATFADRSYVPP